MMTNRNVSLRSIPSHEPELPGRVALHYVARAGLLPELSRQTYDSFPKALREAVLNAADARATRVDVDLSRVVSHHEMTVADDGVGMSTKEFCEQFMSLGGSSKFGDRERFGRIGIGSLALLRYGEAAVVETKRSGTQTATRARVQHPWVLGRDERRGHLGELAAGYAEEFQYDGSPRDQFTRIRLEGLNSEIGPIGQDPTAFYKLVEDLRRILPLPWSDGRLADALVAVSPDLVDTLREHISLWSTPVFLHSEWERDVRLLRRSYGDDQAGIEDWSGPPVPILKKLRVADDGPRREILVAGYLLNQKRAQATWAGLTTRVQNVAVEQHTFFDVTADPGFRKYITGEIWILGDVDRERLINIDRSSFNRECADYHAIQRFMSRMVVEFKSRSVQRPQRQKVIVRRLLEDQVRTVQAVGRIAEQTTDFLQEIGHKALPSSEPGRGSRTNRRSIVDLLRSVNADVILVEDRPNDDLSYDLDLSQDGQRVEVALGPGLIEPRVSVGSAEYRIVSAEAGPDEPPVFIRNRPREIVFNVSHGAHAAGDRHLKYQLSLTLELAYLLGSNDAEAVYNRMVAFIEAM
jgi:hypothetical protein